MATKAPSRSKPADAPLNLPAVNSDEFTEALRKAGFLPTAGAGGSDINRLTVKGTNIVDSNGDIVAVYNQKTREPALIVQLLGEPVQYQAFWFDKDGRLANAINDQLGSNVQTAGRFCKSHFDDPNEGREYAENGASCRECPVGPFVKIGDLPPEADGKRCSWKADVEFYILEQQPDGTYAATDDTVYTMTLPTTAVIEFFGASKKGANQLAGSVSEHSTMVRIGMLGMRKWGKEGVLKAKTFYSLGGGIFALHILPASNDDRSRTWNVPSFDPVDIVEIEDRPQLETSEPAADVSDEAVPF